MSTEGWHKIKLDGRSDYKISDGNENLVATFIRPYAVDYILALAARARWAEDVARPALEHVNKFHPSCTHPAAALATYPQPEKETPA